MEPTFSVIIPTYNRPTQTLAAVKSVLQQTYRAYEIIVIDDSSTDDTVKLLSSYQKHVRCLRGLPSGTANARNRGIQEATKDYVAFLDSDDYWRHDKLEVMSQYLKRYPSVGLIGSGYYFVDSSGNVLHKERYVRLKGNAYRQFLESDYAATSAVVVRRACFATIGLFDETLSGCEDWDMWIRLTRYFPMLHIHDTLAYITINNTDRRSNSYDGRWFQGMDAVVAKALQADPSIDTKTKQRIGATLNYTKGKASLMSGDQHQAITYFHQARIQNPSIYKAIFYDFALSNPWFQALIPPKLRARLSLSVKRSS